MRVGLLAFFLLTTSTALTQEKDQRYCFEPVFGISHVQVRYATSPSLTIEDNSSPGLKFGLIRNWAIGNRVVLRPGVLISGYSRKTWLTDHGNEDKRTMITNNYNVHAHLPFHITEMFGNRMRKTFMYLVQGVTYDMNLSNQDFRQDLWLESRDNLTLDLGVGTRFYKHAEHLFALELTYSIGLMNALETSFSAASEFNQATQQAYWDQLASVRRHFLELKFLF